MGFFEWSIKIVMEATFLHYHCLIYYFIQSSCCLFHTPIVSGVITQFFSHVNTPIVGRVNTPFFQNVNTPLCSSVNTPFFSGFNTSIFVGVNTPMFVVSILCLRSVNTFIYSSVNMHAYFSRVDISINIFK